MISSMVYNMLNYFKPLHFAITPSNKGEVNFFFIVFNSQVIYVVYIPIIYNSLGIVKIGKTREDFQGSEFEGYGVFLRGEISKQRPLHKCD